MHSRYIIPDITDLLSSLLCCNLYEIRLRIRKVVVKYTIRELFDATMVVLLLEI